MKIWAFSKLNYVWLRETEVLQVNVVKAALALFCDLFSAMAALGGGIQLRVAAWCKKKPGLMGGLP